MGGVGNQVVGNRGFGHGDDVVRCGRLGLQFCDPFLGLPELAGACEFPVKDLIDGLLAVGVEGAVFFYMFKFRCFKFIRIKDFFVFL